MPAPFTVTAWGPERPEMTFRASSAGEAYDLVLSKAVYASLQVKVTDENGQEITLEDLSRMAIGSVNKRAVETGGEGVNMKRTYRIVTKGASGTMTSMARSAREATEEAAKAAHHGEEVTVTDDNGTEITAEALAELVKLQE